MTAGPIAPMVIVGLVAAFSQLLNLILGSERLRAIVCWASGWASDRNKSYYVMGYVGDTKAYGQMKHKV